MIIELRDPEEARHYLAQGLWLSRAFRPDEETAAATLAWALELASTGEPLPPVGLVADVGQAAIGCFPRLDGAAPAQGLPASLIRRYEDYVLGKLSADLTFERGASALMRFQGRDRSRGLAFLIRQLAVRARIGGAMLSPAVLKRMAENPQQALADGEQSLLHEGLLPLLIEQYEALVEGVRHLGNVLGVEDVFELERGTAIADFGQRLGMRQALQAAQQIEECLPRHRPPQRSQHKQVASKMMDEDTYPVGGFSSLANRGSVESLLQSQLAFMEKDERPDLFDIKFLRDELLYYARDDNQFLRRRRTFLFLLDESFAQARIKDPDLPWQRAVAALGLMLAVVRRLTDLLGDEALLFEFVFPAEGLADEWALVEVLLRDQIANGTVAQLRMPWSGAGPHLQERARRSLTAAVVVGVDPPDLPSDAADVFRLNLRRQSATLTSWKGDELAPPASDWEQWRATGAALLQAWI